MDALSMGDFYRGRRVFITGHTGFKGGWLTLWLRSLGAQITGYALAPPTDPSLFSLAGMGSGIDDLRGDIRDGEALRQAVAKARPDVIFHLAAQAIVRTSYEEPAATFAANVQGTVNLLEAARGCPGVRSVVAVTSDKCYQNKGLGNAFAEDDPLGGDDPYSASKACAELAAHSWDHSFLRPMGIGLATARAGNVIGGGDFARDRLVPDILRAFGACRPVSLRNPGFVRPWQHVLEPLYGYLLLGRRLWEHPERYAGAWNFGPSLESCKSVEQVAQKMRLLWGESAGFQNGSAPPNDTLSQADNGKAEAPLLRLDAGKAAAALGWRPVWDLDAALLQTVSFEKRRLAGEAPELICRSQIAAYEEVLARLSSQ